MYIGRKTPETEKVLGRQTQGCRVGFLRWLGRLLERQQSVVVQIPDRTLSISAIV